MASVLDEMTATITQTKQQAALTPVGTEKPLAIPNDVPGVFMSNEMVKMAAKDLRKHAAMLVEVADGLDKLVGIAVAEGVAGPDALPQTPWVADTPTEQMVHAVDALVAEIKSGPADETFEERFTRLSASAKAAAYEGNLVPAAREVFAEPAASGSPVPGWVCPEHGAEGINDLTSAKGRKYRACTICTQFEK